MGTPKDQDLSRVRAPGSPEPRPSIDGWKVHYGQFVDRTRGVGKERVTRAKTILHYVTGRAFGTSADVRLPLLPITVPAQPDTGTVRTADATSVTPPCSAMVSTPGLDARLLCAGFTSTLNPSTGTATLKQISIGLPGWPLIELTGIRATAVARCGAAAGSTTATLTIAVHLILGGDLGDIVIGSATSAVHNCG